jgi:hypothetical protein
MYETHLPQMKAYLSFVCSIALNVHMLYGRLHWSTGAGNRRGRIGKRKREGAACAGATSGRGTCPNSGAVEFCSRVQAGGQARLASLCAKAPEPGNATSQPPRSLTNRVSMMINASALEPDPRFRLHGCAETLDHAVVTTLACIFFWISSSWGCCYPTTHNTTPFRVAHADWLPSDTCPTLICSRSRSQVILGLLCWSGLL